MNEPKRTTAEVMDEQRDLAPLPEELEEEAEGVSGLLDRTTQDALAKRPGLDLKAIQTLLDNRGAMLSIIRKTAIAQTKPQQWTLYRAKDASVVGVPSAPACRVMGRWAGISVRNHRDMRGQLGIHSEREVLNSKNETVLFVEMQADGFWGKNTIPAAEGVYANLRSDDDFTGRAKREDRLGGARPQDLYLAIRTEVDSKAVREMLAVTKVPLEELVEYGIDEKKCTKGMGYGTAQDRQASAGSSDEVKSRAATMKQEHLAAADGKLEGAVVILKDCTKYNAFTGSDGNQVPASQGLDSWDKFTTIAKIEKAEARWKKHPLYPAPAAAAPKGKVEGE